MRGLSKILLLIFLLFLLANNAFACTLAVHDWKILYHVKTDLSAPLIPLAELNTAQERIATDSASMVIWSSDHNRLSIIGAAFIEIFYGILSRLSAYSHISYISPEARYSWLSKIPWFPVQSGVTVGRLAHESSGSALSPLIIGSDNYSLRMAFFYDQNSDGRSYHFIISQEGRIRAVHANKNSPWAQEIQSTSFLSLIFYAYPVPGKILSLSIYPVAGQRMFIVENDDLVMHLLAHNLLTPRMADDFDPDFYRLPEFPE